MSAWCVVIDCPRRARRGLHVCGRHLWARRAALTALAVAVGCAAYLFWGPLP